jgi:hypothetical protein
MSRFEGGLRIIGWRGPMNKSKLVVMLTLVLAAGRAEAQVAEVSLGVGGANVSGGYESWSFAVHSPALDARANVRLSDRFSIEPFVTYGRRSIPATAWAPYAVGADSQRTEGMYGVVVHQRLRSLSRSGFSAYLSYGLNGTYFKLSTPERQFVYGPRNIYTQPAYTIDQTDPMILPSVGFGVRKSLGNHLAVRADADMVTFFGAPVGGRASVGVVVPIGANK